MTYKTPKTIADCFPIILQGDKDASRKVTGMVRKLLYSSNRDATGKFSDIKKLVNEAAQIYAQIKETWRQENFVRAISVIYYLHDREREPDFLFPWLLELLKHENGSIRYATVRMFETEFGPLTVHIRCPDKKRSLVKSTPKQADEILAELAVNLGDMLFALWQPKYKKYKYISSLPASSYKSVQMVLANMIDDCGQDYVGNLIISKGVRLVDK